MKVGDIKYGCYVDEDGIDFSTWVCRTIRGGVAYWVHKSDHVTWVRIPNKHGKQWAKNIPPSYRMSVYLNSKFSQYELENKGNTKVAAARKELATLRGHVQKKLFFDEEDKQETFDNIKRLERYVAQYKGKA